MDLRVEERPVPASEALPPPREAGGAPWYWSVSEACKRLGVDPGTGLDPLEAARRLARDGPNALPAPHHRGLARMVVGQFADVMVLLLLASAVVAGLLGELQDIAAIVAIVVLNAALGVVQEYRAERALAALRALAAPQAWVRRGGEVGSVPAVELVHGDVVALEAGNREVLGEVRDLEQRAAAGLRPEH